MGLAVWQQPLSDKTQGTMLMLPDTVVVLDPNDDSKGLYRIAGGVEGLFRDADADLRLRVATAYGKRQRSLVRLDYQKVVPDPLLAGVNVPSSMSAQLVVDLPRNGAFSASTMKEFGDNFVKFLLSDGTSGSGVGGGILSQIILGES